MMRRGGYAGEMAEKIQRHALSRQERARQTLQFGDDAAFGNRTAIWSADDQTYARIGQLERKVGGNEARHHARLAGHDDRVRALFGRDDRVRGDVTGAAQIFGQRPADDRLDDDRVGRVGEGKGERIGHRLAPSESHAAWRRRRAPGFTLSIASTAALARAAISGSTVTSVVSV